MEHNDRIRIERPPAIAITPPSVARYLRHVLLRDGQIRHARLEQAGVLRKDVHDRRWLPFTATHAAAPPTSSFQWNARVRIAPLVHLQVRDTLADGVGSGQVRLWSLIPVAAAGGNLAMNSGALHRYLAEAVWYPTALIPSERLRWRAIDEHAAEATLENHGVSVSLEFRFDARGEVTGIHTPARWGSFGGGYRQAPWQGHFRDYVEHDGVLVPSYGEVGWQVEGAWQTVWKGSIEAAMYEWDGGAAPS